MPPISRIISAVCPPEPKTTITEGQGGREALEYAGRHIDTRISRAKAAPVMSVSAIDHTSSIVALISQVT